MLWLYIHQIQVMVLKRLDYRMKWDEAFSTYLKSLDKPVMACGDFNVANEEIDIKNPKDQS